MARKVQPIDMEAIRQNPTPWPVQYISDVLCEIYNRENGTNIHFRVTPKDPAELEQRGR